jgi:8-oxo-dGTP pyrophosphatase MutT (NUDIX family)
MPLSDYIVNLRAKIGHDLLLVSAVNGVVLDDAGQVLLQRATLDGCWAVPGGGMDPGEQPAAAVAREILEETGLVVEPYHLVNVCVEEPVQFANGDRVQYLVITFLCRITGGELRISDDESLELRFFPPDAMPEVRPAHRGRVQQALSGMSGGFLWEGAWRSNAT